MSLANHNRQHFTERLWIAMCVGLQLWICCVNPFPALTGYKVNIPCHR